MNVDDYFRRIAYHGDRAPALSTLHAICEAHVGAIPFENLDARTIVRAGEQCGLETVLA